MNEYQGTALRDVMTVSQAAEELSFCKETVYRLINAKKLGCIRIPGASIRILRRHINEFLETFECPASSSQNTNHTSSSGQSGETGMPNGRAFKLMSAKSKAQASRLKTVRAPNNG